LPARCRQTCAAVSGAGRRRALAPLSGRFDIIASAIDLHRVALTYVTNKKGGDQILSALPGIADRQHRDFGRSAIVESIRTDLISGGVESGAVEAPAAFVDEAEKYIAGRVGIDAEVGGADAQRQIVSAMVRDRLQEFVRLLDMPTVVGTNEALTE